MAYVATKSKFHVALDGQGLILQGAPDRPGYVQDQAPLYGNRFASGDRDIDDLTFWWYWSQTDWSGGIKEEGDWADDAKFATSKNIDAFSTVGKISILVKPTVQTTSLTNTNRVNVGVFGNVGNAAAQAARFYIATRATTVDGSNGAKVWHSTDGDSWTQLMHFVNVDTCRDLFFGQDGSNNRYLFAVFNKGTQKYDGSTVTDISANAGSNFFGCGVSHAGAAFIVSGILSSFPTMKKSTDAFATAGSSFLTFQYGENVRNMASFNGNIYYLLERGGGITELRKVDGATASTDTLVLTFVGLTPSVDTDRLNTALRVVGNQLLIFFDDGSVWSVTTSDIVTRIYKDLNDYFAFYNTTVKSNRALAGNIVVENNSGAFSIFNDRRNADDAGQFLPIATNGTTTLYISSSGNLDKVYRDAAGTYYTSGTLNTNEFANISGIDKLFNAITLVFKALASGQSIKVEYSTDGGTTFTEVGGTGNGTASFTDDGAITSKVFKFGSNVVSKKILLRFTLAGGGTNTPELHDFSLQYVPIPIYSKQWRLSVNCADEVKRLDGRLVETTARELKARLEVAWATKALLDFQDLDYATTLLNGALTSSATTITVDSTVDFPEQGRLKIGDEEVFYTGKTPTTFTGVTRAVRGTMAAAHLNNAVVNNAYKVLVTDLSVRAPILLEDKNLEYTVGLVLREA